MPGALVDDNIYQAISKSRQILCIRSSNFIKSPYYMREFEVSTHRNIVLGKEAPNSGRAAVARPSWTLNRSIFPVTPILIALQKTFKTSCSMSCRSAELNDLMQKAATIWPMKVLKRIFNNEHDSIDDSLITLNPWPIQLTEIGNFLRQLNL